MNQRTCRNAFELQWTRTGDDRATPHTALARSWARTPTDLTIEYEGWSKEDSQPFSGTIKLPLDTAEYEVWGTGTLGSDPAPFRLVGAFKNEECTLYEGTWHEDSDYVATFSFETNV